MRIIVLGAGHIGSTLVDALHAEHEITVIGLDAARLQALAERYDVRTVQGDGTTREIVRKAGCERADLLLASSPREEANLVCAILAKRQSAIRTVVRTTSVELLEAWREGEIDVDYMISPELETANAIAGVLGLPAARQTDTFAQGRVQIVEFDVPADSRRDTLVGRPLREAATPPDSKVAAILRGERTILPGGRERIRAGDRIIVIASPASAQAWSRLLTHDEQTPESVTVFGAGRMGTAIARVLLERDLRVRLVDSRADRAHEVAQDLPGARVFHADGFDPSFLVRQRIDQSATVFCLADDARNLYGAVLARVYGARLTVTLVRDPVAAQVYERGGVDVAINPREVTAEEMVRFAHDPRTQQVALFEGHRFEILDVTVRPDSTLAHRRFKELPTDDALIGALIRDDQVHFPHGSDMLEPGDRVIVFVSAAGASAAVQAL